MFTLAYCQCGGQHGTTGVRASERLTLEGPDQKTIGESSTGDVRAPWLVDHRCLRPTTQGAHHIHSALRPGLHSAHATGSKGIQDHDLTIIYQARRYISKLRLRHKLGQGTC